MGGGQGSGREGQWEGAGRSGRGRRGGGRKDRDGDTNGRGGQSERNGEAGGETEGEGRRECPAGGWEGQAGGRWGEAERWEGNVGANRRQRGEADTSKNLLTVSRNLESCVFTGAKFTQAGRQAGTPTISQHRQADPWPAASSSVQILFKDDHKEHQKLNVLKHGNCKTFQSQMSLN